MRYLILSDIHSNATALDAVLDAAGDVDGVLVLGDIVGYGCQPNEVVDRVRELPGLVAIRGNHDRAVVGREDDGQGFNPPALAAALWNREALRPENLDWLDDLPVGPVEVPGGVLLVHGAPHDEDAYTFNHLDAELAFHVQQEWVVLFGHTHLPVVFRSMNGQPPAGKHARPGTAVLLERPPVRWLANPGSVGQPRDGIPQAAFALLDLGQGRIEFHRAAYDIADFQQSMHEAGLPRELADRLSLGA